MQDKCATLTERPALDAVPALIAEWIKDEQTCDSRKKKFDKLGPEQFTGMVGFALGKQVS